MPKDNDNRSEDNDNLTKPNGNQPDSDVDITTDTPIPGADTSDQDQPSEPPPLNKESHAVPPPDETLDEPKHVFDDDPEMASSEPDDKPEDPPTPPKSSAPQTPPPEPTQLPEDDIFSKLVSHPASVPGLVTDWLSSVQVNGPASVAEALNLVVKMARPQGCNSPGPITPDMIVTNQPRASIEGLSAVLSVEVDGKAPITAKNMSAKRVRRAFEDFWMKVSAESPHDVLFDTDCFDTLISWFEALAVARSRSLRTAASTAAYRVVDGFLQYGIRLRKQLASLQKQLATEKRRCSAASNKARGKGRGRSSPRVNASKRLSEKAKDLAKKVDNLTANNRELNELSDKVFDLVFILKYRDVSSEIRSISVTALGSWTVTHPDHFLENRHMKYLGWLLSDKDPAVRRSTLEILLRMMKKKEFYQDLHLFMTTFCDRVVEMTRDKDDTVVVAAIRLLTCLAGHQLVGEENCDKVCAIAVGERQLDIRRAAGEFLSCVLSNDERNGLSKRGKRKPTSRSSRGTKPKSSSSKNGRNPNEVEITPIERSTHILKELLSLIGRNEKVGKGTDLAVDAVWDSMPALRCWEAFSTLLRDEGRGGRSRGAAAGVGNSSSFQIDEPLSEHERAVVAEILLASVREASGHGGAERKVIVARGERQSPEPPGLGFSRMFLPILPRILVQFQAEVRALTALVQLPMHFHTDCIEQEGHDDNFHEILLKILDIMSRHTGSPKLFNACAKTYRVLLSDDNPLRSAALKSMQHGYSTAAKEFATLVRADLSKAEPMTVAAAVLRVRSLSELVQPSSSVYDSIISILQHQIEKGPLSTLSEEVTTDAARTGSALIMWTLSKVRSRLTASLDAEGPCQDVARDEIEAARSKGAAIVDLLGQLSSSVSVSLLTRLVCLQGLLTTVALCRGVERFAGKCLNLSTVATDSQEAPEEAALDLLRVHSKTESLTSIVRSCVISVVEHNRGLQDHTLYVESRPRGRRKRAVIPEIAVKDFFASVIQASYQSVLSAKISHLPVLGLLLKRKKASLREVMTGDWTTFELCKKYCEDPPMRESQRIRYEVLAIRETAQMQNSSQRDQLERELGDIILSVRPNGLPRRRACKQVLVHLINMVREPIAAAIDLETSIKMLVAVGSSFVHQISPDDAKAFLEKLEPVHASLTGENPPPDSPGSSSLQLFSDCLKAVVAGNLGELSNLSRRIQQGKGIGVSNSSKKRKRSSPDASAYRTSSSFQRNPGTLRRSGRHQKRVDYSQPSIVGEDNDCDEENCVESSDPNDGDDPVVESDEKITVAKDVAHGVMECANSPRAPTKPTNSQPGQPRLGPEKEITRESGNGMLIQGGVAGQNTGDPSEAIEQNAVSNNQPQAESSVADTQDGADEQASVDHDAADGITAEPGKATSRTAGKRGSSRTADSENAKDSNKGRKFSDISRNIKKVNTGNRRSERIRRGSQGSAQEGNGAAGREGNTSDPHPSPRLGSPLKNSTSVKTRRARVSPQDVTSPIAETRKRNAKVASEGKENVKDGHGKRSEVPVVRRRKRQKRW